MPKGLTKEQRRRFVDVCAAQAKAQWPHAGGAEACTTYLREMDEVLYRNYFVRNCMDVYRLKWLERTLALRANGRQLFAAHSAQQLAELPDIELGRGFVSRKKPAAKARPASPVKAAAETKTTAASRKRKAPPSHKGVVVEGKTADKGKGKPDGPRELGASKQPPTKEAKDTEDRGKPKVAGPRLGFAPACVVLDEIHRGWNQEDGKRRSKASAADAAAEERSALERLRALIPAALGMPDDAEAGSGVRCPQCGTTMKYTEMATRSADEPVTVFATCTNAACGHVISSNEDATGALSRL